MKRHSILILALTAALSSLPACGGSTETAAASATAASATATATATAATATAATATAATATAATIPGAHAKDIDVAELKAWLDSDHPFLLDVRTPAEFAQGHVPGAVNISLQDLPQRLSELESHKAEAFAVICAVGGRSAAAAALLRENGFVGVSNVKSGTRAWVQAGYAVD